ncbi:MAG: class IV adenylate cyclase [Firmicutes bacterium]|nr:class IV adenylate cyclase [Bacillota bacterium]
MKEIEILVEVLESEEKVLKALEKFEFKGDKLTVDTYICDPLRPATKPTVNKKNGNVELEECIRVREANNKVLITHKINRFDEAGNWQYADEFETQVTNAKETLDIFYSIGFKELVKVRNLKRVYVFGNYEIVFERVDELGLFLEVEFSTDDEKVDIVKTRREIQKFIDSLGFKTAPESGMGKPEMMLKLKKLV